MFEGGFPLSKTIRLTVLAVLAVAMQTTLAGYIRVAGVAPELLIAFMVLATSYTGPYGGFCLGAIIALLYDSTVGYVLALNFIGYTFIGWAATMMRASLDLRLRKLKHKSVLVMMILCFALTLMWEMLHIGFLFLIGAEQGVMTIIRMLLCCAYSTVMILPLSLIAEPIMNWHPRLGKKEKQDMTKGQ